MAKRFMEHVRGTQVVGAEGHAFGEVVDLELEGLMTLSGLVIRVKSSNLAKLGIKKPFWNRATLVIPAASVKVMDDVVILRSNLEQFSQQLKAAEAEKIPARKQAKVERKEQTPAPEPHS